MLAYQFFSKNFVFAVSNGEINGDYALLQNKPKIGVITIDNRSAVIIEDKSGKLSLLLSGIHILINNPKIIATFYLGVRFFQVGPSKPAALSPKLIQESLTEYHARICSAEETKTSLTSGEIIFPSFSVFYRLDISGNPASGEEKLQTLYAVSRLIDSSFFKPADLENLLTLKLINSWRRHCEKKNKEDILTNFPGYFEPNDIYLNGVVSQIYIDEIY